ncbi:ATP-binding protein [Streptomyces sp. NPDC057950]|uniref:ATP-binding protein n=1 Tax=Streptomyces sp. NPDC057950 TaxID=3346288 RepID=UPI0036E2AEF6
MPWAARTPLAASPSDGAPTRVTGPERPGRSEPAGNAPRSASLRITESPQGFAQARDFTRRTLGRWALGDRGDDAALVVTELATNAVLHAVPRPGADQTGVWLKLTLRRAHLVCAVTDQSESPPVCPRTDGALEVHGRGLRIVEALSEHWGWTLSPAGKTVWAMLPALPRPTPSAWHGLT